LPLRSWKWRNLWQPATLAGRTTVAELDQDATLAGQCVNEAYLDTYINTTPGGRRPGWALQTAGIQFSAPVTGTVTVTQGSNSFSALTGVTAAMAGSVIQIGAGYYKLASTTSTVEPIAEATGSQAFTLWHNSYPLPAANIELEGGPLVIGWGLLKPMNGRMEDIKWRQITYGDFWGPTPFGAGLMTTINWPGGVSNPTGTPIWYYVDNSFLVSGAAIQARMVIWPMPTQLTTVQYQGWITPTELSADGDLPVLPANLITRVLLPLAREKWVMLYKKYTGGNQAYVVREADKARAILAMTSQGQRDKPTRMVLRNV
jgi:hypothetical protein